MSSFVEVPVSSICSPAKRQRLEIPREGVEELARSIAQVGLLQPLVVKAVAHGYEIIAGERRLLAVKMLGLVTVTCSVREADDEQSHAMMLTENLQRAALSPVEEARAVQARVEVLGESVEEVARTLGKSEPWVRGRLAMCSWPEAALRAVALGELSMAAARPLVELEDTDERDRLLRCAVDAGANAAVTTGWVAAVRGLAVSVPENESAYRSTQREMVGWVMRMPCFCCRQEFKGLDMRVVRLCAMCTTGIEQASVASAELPVTPAGVTESSGEGVVTNSEVGRDLPARPDGREG